ncbi:MAG: phosphatidylglycerol---prolipoprotein diacylglyceryl transferase [Patescibacteria group bacterium]|jgi:phosphatidylglycerol:prolipoprotein diacylglycerol transferase|nr:phosphatidylglycerol---prolipoprotein diacylglyceryl transferase [Patescibacteria group bacterium]
MISWWQNLPLNMDPIAFMLGSFPLRFYSIFWVIGFFLAWWCLSLLLRIDGREKVFQEKLFDGLVWVFLGAFIGGRFGYALLYMPEYFWQHPSAIFFPVEAGVFIGFYGMSFFGGVLGVAFALALFLRKKRESFFELADYYALVAPVAIFFGRIGNFFNGELSGRVTAVSWGMYFPSGGVVLHHPSQLYEAFLEGAILFIFLWFIRHRTREVGILSVSFLLGYGILRFIAEFFREPDQGSPLFFGFSLGQIYSVALVLISIFIFFSIRRRKDAII